MLNKIPYINFAPGNRFGTRASNVLCTKGLPLRFCQLFNFAVLGGDPTMPFMPNTDPVSFYLEDLTSKHAILFIFFNNLLQTFLIFFLQGHLSHHLSNTVTTYRCSTSRSLCSNDDHR